MCPWTFLTRCSACIPPAPPLSGLWFDLDIAYSGSFLMTLETKMNLIRLGKEEDALRIEPGKDG